MDVGLLSCYPVKRLRHLNSAFVKRVEWLFATGDNEFMKYLEKVPKSPPLLVLFGVLMVLPTMSAGFIMDDVLARVKLMGLNTPWSPAPWWDLYTFAREDLNVGLLAAGQHPWWADPQVKMTFFRPLSAATHILDYTIWPDSSALQHLHSALWYGLAVALAVSLYRLLLKESPTAMGIAGLVFALAPAHVSLVGWTASRNTIITFVFCCLILRLHIHWFQNKRLSSLFAAVGLLVVGLFAGEAVIGALGYVFAWQVCMVRTSWKERFAALVPYGVVFVVWRWLYVAYGFGSANTSIYRDPATDLMGFIKYLVTNLPMLLFGRWSLFPLDFWAVIPPGTRNVVFCVALLFLFGLVFVLWPLLRSKPLARFWALGMVLSLMPFTATLPMDRLVLFGGLGMAALLGMLVDAPLERTFALRARSVLVFLHVPLAVVWGLFRASTMSLMIMANSSGFEQAPRDKDVPNQTFVYVTSTFHRVHYMTLMRHSQGDTAIPKRIVVLSSMFTGTNVTRRDRHTLEVKPKNGFMWLELDRIHRRKTRAFRVGQVVKLPDVRITVLKVAKDGRPALAAFRFRVPLEDRSLRWLVVKRPKDASLPFYVETKAFPLPSIGQTVKIPSVF